MTPENSVIEFRDVVKIYPLPAGDVLALNHVSLQVGKGEFVTLMGPSGSGKSTLLNLIGCLDVPTTGDLIINGTSIREMSDDQLTLLRRDTLGFIFQQFNLLPLLNVIENVEFPLLLRNDGRHNEERCREVLAAVSLAPELFTHKPTELSGGQQQRVAIARALVNDPEILLCDEPTGNLDRKTGTGIMELLAELNRQGKTIIMVTHDPKTALYASRTVRIEDGILQ